MRTHCRGSVRQAVMRLQCLFTAKVQFELLPRRNADRCQRRQLPRAGVCFVLIVNPLSVSSRNRVRTETRAAFAERLPPDRNYRTAVPRRCESQVRNRGFDSLHPFTRLCPIFKYFLRKWHSEGPKIR